MEFHSTQKIFIIYKATYLSSIFNHKHSSDITYKGEIKI